MVESILQKAIQSAGQSYSYSPQQVAEMLDIQAKNIEMLEIRISFTWWILVVMIIAFAVMGIISSLRFEKKLKQIKKSIYS
jgi:ABC-type transport system involved in multi-copper enzyme maturation permease subunit